MCGEYIAAFNREGELCVGRQGSAERQWRNGGFGAKMYVLELVYPSTDSTAPDTQMIRHFITNAIFPNSLEHFHI